MKTNNNVQKATKLVTLGLMMVLGMGVYATGIGTPVLDTDGKKQLADSKDVFASYMQIEAEPNMEVEAWMTDENSFDVFAAYQELDGEEALEVEGWMTNESIFYPLHTSLDTLPNPNEVLEEWMTSNEVWHP